MARGRKLLPSDKPKWNQPGVNRGNLHLRSAVFSTYSKLEIAYELLRLLKLPFAETQKAAVDSSEAKERPTLEYVLSCALTKSAESGDAKIIFQMLDRLYGQSDVGHGWAHEIEETQDMSQGKTLEQVRDQLRFALSRLEEDIVTQAKEESAQMQRVVLPSHERTKKRIRDEIAAREEKEE